MSLTEKDFEGLPSPQVIYPAPHPLAESQIRLIVLRVLDEVLEGVTDDRYLLNGLIGAVGEKLDQAESDHATR